MKFTCNNDFKTNYFCTMSLNVIAFHCKRVFKKTKQINMCVSHFDTLYSHQRTNSIPAKPLFVAKMLRIRQAKYMINDIGGLMSFKVPVLIMYSSKDSYNQRLNQHRNKFRSMYF